MKITHFKFRTIAIINLTLTLLLSSCNPGFPSIESRCRFPGEASQRTMWGNVALEVTLHIDRLCYLEGEDVIVQVTLHNIGEEPIILHNERSIVVIEFWRTEGNISELLEIWPMDGQSDWHYKQLEIGPGEQSVVHAQFSPLIETNATIRAKIQDGELELANLDISFRCALPGPG